MPSEVDRRTVVAAVAGLILAALPTFFVGGLAVQIRRDLGVSAAALGLSVSAAFLVGAMSGPAAGRLVDRIGPLRAMTIGAALSVTTLLGLGLLVEDLLTLVIFLAVGGASFSFMDPGLAVLIAETTAPRRQGLVFGIKEAAIPAASLVAGLAIPSIALDFGWRWVLALGVVPVVLLAVVLPRLRGQLRAQVATPAPSGPRPSRKIWLVAAAAALAATAASGLGVLFTDSAVSMGVSEAAAGWLLAIGAVAGIVVRIVSGLVADRTGGEQLRLVTVMIGLGAAAIVVGSFGTLPALTVAVIGVFAGSWGWTGLLFVSLVRLRPDAPGSVSGIGLAGLAVGNGLGPAAFGGGADAFSYPVAWLGAGALATAAAVTMWFARKRLLNRSGTDG